MNINSIKIGIALVFLAQLAQAQFTIFNTLKTKEETGLRIGDNAYLTAKKGVDANGEGWLRLTEAKANQKGYMYVMQSFPTTLGVLADFEYTAWRNADDSYYGADGFTMFLFNGNISDANFKLGGYGGSLGYAPLSATSSPGLTGGYIGIGFDAYGNYARKGEGRTTGITNYAPNAVVLRGPTTTDNNSNKLLTYILLGNRSGSDNDIRKRNEIDYNTKVSSRPALELFYRRVQVTITKSGNNYIISAKWRKEAQTTFTPLFTYTVDSSTYPLPDILKIGFAGSTGGGFNFQEIRNILLTTPGNLRVDSRSDLALACTSTTTPIMFKIEVTNDTSTALTNINYSTEFKDSNNVLLDLEKFKITSVSLSSEFTNSNIPTSNFTSNSITGIVGLPANTSGIVTVVGEYKGGLPTNSTLTAESNINSLQVTDIDETNNTAKTSIDIRKCNVITNPNLPIYNYK